MNNIIKNIEVNPKFIIRYYLAQYIKPKKHEPNSILNLNKDFYTNPVKDSASNSKRR